ncbi:MAG TPA: LytTR family DNA-binding domain-containing protein [Candidatus Eisenbacteria bacterium]|nr:LytTR family DNA-binding domain-containing protein [Candidatus Eisenbacteria bacterium]
MIRALIVDDEELARDKLRRLLAEHEDVHVVGEAKDGDEAVDLLEKERPDVVFLDIDMPQKNGFEVLDAIGSSPPPPLVVFVTAFDQHAVQAFEVHAVDYLLKPFEEHRLRAALQRARERREGSVSIEPLLGVLAEMRSRQQQLEGRLLGDAYPHRIPVREGQEILFVDLEDIDWMEAADNYVQLHSGRRVYMVRETLAAMEARLDPKRFTRIHRGAIVNDRKVRSLRPQASGDLEAVLRDGTALPVSRTYRERVTTKWEKG